MRAMFHKEFLCLKRMQKYIWVLWIFCVVIMFLTIDSTANTFRQSCLAALFVTSFAAGSVINCPYSDEKVKWDTYARTLPVSVKSIVGARYLFGAAISAPLILVAALAVLVKSGGNTDAAALTFLLSLCTPALAISVALPLCYRFNSRIGSFGMIILTIFPLVGLEMDDAAFFQPFAGLLLLAAVLLVFASFFLSCRIYARKER